MFLAEKIKTLVVFVVIGGLWSTSLIADQVLVIQANKKSYPLSPYLNYYEDKLGDLDVKQLSSPDFYQKWNVNDQTVANFGYTSSTYWLRLMIRNDLTKHSQVFIELENNILGDVEYFTRNWRGDWVKKRFSNELPFSQRDVSFNRPVFRLDISPYRNNTIYLKFRATSALYLPLTLWESQAFAEKIIDERSGSFLYLGLLLIMSIYHLCLFFKERKNIYFYYALAIGLYMLVYMAYKGLAFQYLWSQSIAWERIAFPFLLSVCHVSWVIFTRSLINIERSSRTVYFLLKLSIFAAMIGLIVIIVSSAGTGIMVSSILTCLIFPIYLYSAYISYQNGDQCGKYYLRALTFFLAGIALSFCYSMGLIFGGVLPKLGLEIGSAIALIYAAMAIDEYIKYEYEQSKIAIRDVNESLRRKITEKSIDTRIMLANIHVAHKESELLRKKVDLQQEELKEADNQKNNFFQSISHELRTPLTVIINPLEHAAGVYKDDQNIRIALKNSWRLLRMINQLLDFQKITVEKNDLTLTPLDIRYFVNLCGDYFSAACVHKNITFTVRTDEPMEHTVQSAVEVVDNEGIAGAIQSVKNTIGTKPVWVMAEVQALEKIIFNYLSNALKFTPEEGHIELGLSVKGGIVRVYVKDSGPGISRNNQKKLFKVFNQLDESTSRTDEGTGLGLALAKTLAKHMDGQIGVDSSVGEGSCFWVDFNILKPVKSLTRVLIVIEDQKLGKTIYDSLKSTVNNNEIEWKSSIDDAIAFLEEHSVCCIVSDYNFSNKNGLDLLSVVSHRFPSIYRILITAETTFEMLEKGANEHFVDKFLPKANCPGPFIERLKRLVVEHLSLPQAEFEPVKPVIDLLIVDDDPEVLDFLTLIFLEIYSAEEMAAVSSIGDAKDYLLDHRVRCVLSDYNLGDGADGLDLLAFVTFNEPICKRVLMTAEADLGIMQRALNEGSVDYVFYKPLESSMVRSTVRQLINDSVMASPTALDKNYIFQSWHLAETADYFQQSEEPVVTGSGKRILVIDHMADMRALIANDLRKYGYIVICCNGGKSGLVAAHEYHPDLIITDWIMPEMTGPEFIKNLREDPDYADIPIVLLSAKSDEDSQLVDVENGADALLGKPFNEKELYSLVRNMLQLTETTKREVRHIKDLLAQAEKLSQLGAMVSSVGHEISNPLTLAGVNCELMEMRFKKIDKELENLSKVDDEQVRKISSTIAKKVEDLRKINGNNEIATQRIQDISMALRSQSRLEHEPTKGVDLNELIRESMLITGGKLKMIEVEESFVEIPEITCYRSKIGQVLINIIANAADALIDKMDKVQLAAMEKNNQDPSADLDPIFVARIGLSTQPGDRNGNSGVRIIISDNGDGVPEDIRNSIFNKFFTTKVAGQGTGLGLALSADIVKEHGGVLLVGDDSALGGARFELWLPLQGVGSVLDPKVA